jgi:hypothetical protein
MRTAARLALRLYPPSFRDRYGNELAALAEDLPPSRRYVVDLYLGALRAWLRPAFTGPDSSRGRLQASVSTVWVAWCAGFLLAPTIDKALLDPPGPGVDATVRRLLDVSSALLAVGWAVALAATAVIGWQALMPALRAGRWTVLRPVAPAVLLGGIEAAGLVALAWIARTDVSRPSPATITLASVWVVGLLAFLGCSGFGPAVMIRRLHPNGPVLRVATLLGAVLSLCLAAMTATSLIAVLIARDASLIGMIAPVAAVVAVGVVASSTALVSSARGLLALRSQA